METHSLVMDSLYELADEKKAESSELFGGSWNLLPELENSIDLNELLTTTGITSQYVLTDESATVNGTETIFTDDYIQFSIASDGQSQMPKASFVDLNESDCAVVPTATIKEEDLAQLGLSCAFSTVADTPVSSAEVSTSQQENIPHQTQDTVGRERKTSGKQSRKRHVEKGTEEYVEKRSRNNEAVRKSRDKAKVKQKQTESRVTVLADENEQLQKKVELLTKELTVLKSLFINVGVSVPIKLNTLVGK